VRTAGLTGTAELQRALREFGINADRELMAIVKGTAQNVRTHAIKSIQRGTKSGVTYKKTNPNRTHRASAPGEAPATDTGRLAGSIRADIEGKSAEVSANTEYASPLEFGTQKIEPRPFLFPALEKERTAWERRLNGIVEKAAKGIIK
jgi:phage gpG-like protein